MFLQKGYLSAPRRAPVLWLTALGMGAAFATGLATGAHFGPLPVARTAASAMPEKDVAVTSSIPSASTSRSGYPVEVLRITDGDTFEARVAVWPGIHITTKVRLRGIDAPELKARCMDERAKAEAARAALTKILAEGGVEISRVSIDKFGGRVDADASTQATPNVSAALLGTGLARSYGGGRREGRCP